MKTFKNCLFTRISLFQTEFSKQQVIDAYPKAIQYKKLILLESGKSWQCNYIFN